MGTATFKNGNDAESVYSLVPGLSDEDGDGRSVAVVTVTGGWTMVRPTTYRATIMGSRPWLAVPEALTHAEALRRVGYELVVPPAICPTCGKVVR